MLTFLSIQILKLVCISLEEYGYESGRDVTLCVQKNPKGNDKRTSVL